MRKEMIGGVDVDVDADGRLCTDEFCVQNISQIM
jgi:hypothetical protein